MKKIILLLTCFLTAGIYAQQTVYVNASTGGANNGTSWTDAFTDFQAGVNAASSGESLFIGGGIYQPCARQVFSLKEGVKIYGGFAGPESMLGERNLAAGNTSILKANGYSVIHNEPVLTTAAELTNIHLFLAYFFFIISTAPY